MWHLHRSTARLLRNLRWKALRWSASADQQFHDVAFQDLSRDPFSPAYPGSITIRRFADLAEPAIHDGATVLDLGCGPGEITCELARRRPATTFVGVDHSRQAIEVATAHAVRLGLANVRFDVADVGRYAPAQRVHLVTMFNAFHHLIEPVPFVSRFRALTDDFLLIEPIGDGLGRWRKSLDFDWAALELDKLRARLDHAFAVAVPTVEGGPATEPPGEPVEHRYTMDDFETFFEGFSLTVRGTTSGLVEYPRQLEMRTEWRVHFGEIAYAVYQALDDRLLTENRDLWARHWVIHARPGPRLARREPVAFPEASVADEVLTGPYDVIYGDYEGPDQAPADAEFTTEVSLRNAGFASWSSEGTSPVFLSYKWLTTGGVPVRIEGRRSRLPRPIRPDEGCRVPLVVQTPPDAGRYILAIDLVQEGVTWFSEAGQLPLKVTVKVTKR
jgi:SAM-dependent methyltransferase